MKIPGLYTSGEFARMAHISVRTVRFYDKQNILKPSHVTSAGVRYYSDRDFGRLQQILLLKYLGFSLEDIKEMTIDDADFHFMLNSLKLQEKLIQDRMEQLQLVEQAIQGIMQEIHENQSVNWSHMLHLIHLTGMEKSMKTQYQNASNISARIQLHQQFSQNSQGWFPWLYQQYGITPSMKILEVGCGNGTLWKENLSLIPQDLSVVLSDISSGMLRDAKRELGNQDSRFSFQRFDCSKIPYPDASFDLVIANHVLFYCEDIPAACLEIRRVLKPEGRFICSAYGSEHMKEVSQLVRDFDDRIILSAKKLFERFGRENGPEILSPVFSDLLWKSYEDCLEVDSPELLIAYILSCHGNQNQYILDRYKEFRSFTSKKISPCFHITKDAGIFICQNPHI